MKSSLNIGRLAGIKVYVHWTFVLLIAYIIFEGVRHGDNVYTILFTILLVLTVFVCVTLHELGHALAARRYGVETRDIILLPIGGVAQLERIPEAPKQELVVAIAGPLVNVAIACLLLPYVLFISTTDFAAPAEELSLSLDTFLISLFFINIMLIVFNAIPAFPMDGGRVLRSLLAMKLHRAKATRIAAYIGQAFAILFVGLGFFFNPFLILIGIFVFIGAASENNMVHTAHLLQDLTVKDGLRTQFTTLHIADNIETAIRHSIGSGENSFLVLDGTQEIVGILTHRQLLKAISRKTDIENIAPIVQKYIPIVHPTQKLATIYQMMQEQQYAILPVLEASILVGVLDVENIRKVLAFQKVKKR